MKVFKFGGASVSTAKKIENVAAIIQQNKNENLLVVISAMGKTTNALEKVAEAFFAGEKENALQLFTGIKEQHLAIANELQGLIEKGDAPNSLPITHPSLPDFFTEIEWLLHDKPVRNYDYYYDQIVCVGELLSTAIVSNFLNHSGIQNAWVDVRDIIRTDNNFRDAKVDWSYTGEKVAEQILPLFSKTDIILTQGFIGATDENESTTLGREGSDYSAAVFANLLDAESQTIWKDVQGVMSADPKEYQQAQWIKELNYTEVIEMAYYGAQVIHPKTIKPLQNKNIPLYVRSFLHPMEEGTCIHNKNITELPPVIVYKNQQVLVELSSKDFSFVSDGLTVELYKIFEQLKFKPNLTQNGAISFLCVIDNHPEKVQQLGFAASAVFDVQMTRDLTLLTIRHYNQEIIEDLSASANIILKQQTPETVQLLLQSNG